jgi:hypothetical protein
MAFNTQAPANRLKIIVEGLSGMSAVQFGVPESIGPTVSAYITMGSQTPIKKATATVARDARYFVAFAYRLDGAEATAETTLMVLVDAFLVALYADLTLAGACEGIEIDTGLADAPEYIARSAKEYREYPVVITARQYGSYTVNP